MTTSSHPAPSYPCTLPSLSLPSSLPSFSSLPSSLLPPSLLHLSLFPFLPSVDSIKCFAHAPGFSVARRCLRFLILKYFYRQTQQWICSKLLLKMPQYLKCLATVPCDLSLITISVSNCRLFSDINISQDIVSKYFTRYCIDMCKVWLDL